MENQLKYIKTLMFLILGSQGLSSSAKFVVLINFRCHVLVYCPDYIFYLYFFFWGGCVQEKTKSSIFGTKHQLYKHISCK
jgi:hypothetical protein